MCSEIWCVVENGSVHFLEESNMSNSLILPCLNSLIIARSWTSHTRETSSAQVESAVDWHGQRSWGTHGTHGTYLAKLSLSQAQPACAGRMGSNRGFKSFRPTSRTVFSMWSICLNSAQLTVDCLNLSEFVWIYNLIMKTYENCSTLHDPESPNFDRAECRTKECAPEAMAICGQMLRLVFNMLLRHAISKEHAFCEVKDLSSIHERLNDAESC